MILMKNASVQLLALHWHIVVVLKLFHLPFPFAGINNSLSCLKLTLGINATINIILAGLFGDCQNIFGPNPQRCGRQYGEESLLT